MPWALIAQLTAEGFFIGLTSYQPESDDDREWFGRADGWYAVVGLAWMATAILTFFGSYLATLAAALGLDSHVALSAVGGVSGLATLLLGKHSGTAIKAEERAGSIKSLIADNLLTVITPVFIAVLIILLSDLLDRFVLEGSLLDSALLRTTPPNPGAAEGARLVKWEAETNEWEENKAADLFRLWVWALIFSAIAVVAWITINVNRFSLHSLYRNRLIREFLGASHLKRRPNLFTGFDRADNLRMHQLWSKANRRPFHVVNMALNILASKNLAWQERKAGPFTVTPLHSGSSVVDAYRDSFYYGGAAKKRSSGSSGISLGTAMAVSGAAASPNMGYHSSPSVTVLMALFNVRLGWWLGNPAQ